MIIEELTEMLAEEQFESEEQRRERAEHLKKVEEQRQKKLASIIGRSALKIKIQVFLICSEVNLPFI